MNTDFGTNHSSGPELQSSLDREANTICNGNADEAKSTHGTDPVPARAAPDRRSTRRKVAGTVSSATVSSPRRSQPAKRRATMPADLSPEELVAVIDSREQQPLDLAPLRSRIGTLATGDYSLRGLESVIAIER